MIHQGRRKESKNKAISVLHVVAGIDVLAGVVGCDRAVGGSGDDLPERGVAHVARGEDSRHGCHHPDIGLYEAGFVLLAVGDQGRLGDVAHEDEDSVEFLGGQFAGGLVLKRDGGDLAVLAVD